MRELSMERLDPANLSRESKLNQCSIKYSDPVSCHLRKPELGEDNELYALSPLPSIHILSKEKPTNLPSPASRLLYKDCKVFSVAVYCHLIVGRESEWFRNALYMARVPTRYVISLKETPEILEILKHFKQRQIKFKDTKLPLCFLAFRTIFDC